MPKKILLVDDEIEIRGYLQMYFEDREYKVSMAADGEEALAMVQKEGFDLIVCDMLMPRMIGVEFLRRVKEKNPDQKVIMMTGVRDETMMNKAKSLGCLHYLTKPVKLSELETLVSDCMGS